VKDDRLYLLHIQECIVRIEAYTANGRDAFMGSTLVQDAVARNLQVLGESVRHLSDSIKASQPSIEWKEIAGFRNVLVHDYLNLGV